MKKYKKHLEDSLKLEDAKPVMGIDKDEILHPLFFKQFLAYYKFLEEDEEDFTALVLSGLFLHLTFESYITWIVRWLLRNVNRNKNRRLTKIWENHFEPNAYLSKKIQFFADAFLTNVDGPEIKRIEEFVGELGALRNKIVHGHEFSITNWSDGKVEKTVFAELLTFEKIDNFYKKFKNCMKQISLLLKKIDMEDITPGIPTKEWLVEYLTFKFQDSN